LSGLFLEDLSGFTLSLILFGFYIISFICLLGSRLLGWGCWFFSPGFGLIRDLFFGIFSGFDLCFGFGFSLISLFLGFFSVGKRFVCRCFGFFGGFCFYLSFGAGFFGVGLDLLRFGFDFA